MIDRNSLKIGKATKEKAEIEKPSKLSELPPFTGGKTSGILEADGMEDVQLASGISGPSSQLKGQKIPGMDIVTKTHVEAHAAAIMRQNGIKEATLYINNPPCNYLVGNKPKGCQNVLPNMLPEGAKLTVIGPNGYKQTFMGLPD